MINKQRKKARIIFRWVAWVLLTQFVLINISASIYAYRLTHFYTDLQPSKSYASGNIFQKTWKLFTGPKLPRSILKETPNFPYDTIKMMVANQLPIEDWYSKTDSSEKGTVILIHGILANKGMVIAEAGQFLHMGYNVMLLDLRGHGNSGGNSTTIGVNETEEVKKAYDFIVSKGEKNIFFWGISMGAVIAAKTISDYKLPVSGVILETPFASLQTHLKARARTLSFPEQPFALLVTFWIGLEKGYNGFNHRTTSYVKKITCPVLLQWGELDDYVLKSETTKIFEAINSTHKKLVVYEKAGHESLFKNDPEKWKTEVGVFLSGCLQ